MNYDEYLANLSYLDRLLGSEKVLRQRLNDPSGFFDFSNTRTELNRVQSDIAYLKETQPELFL